MNSNHAQRNENDEHAERGATMVLFAIVLVVLMIASSIAIDLSSLARRGQELQNLADAAALSAVTRLVETGDAGAAQQAGNDALAMSGVTGSDELDLSFSFADGIEARATVTDDSPANFFSIFLPAGNDVVRTATAVLDTCANTCAEQGVEIGTPFFSVRADGSGDGFIPILAKNRLYALNHNEASLVCVDREPDEPVPCWSGQGLPFPDANARGTQTDSIFHTAYVGERIWYGGQENDRYALFCWEVRDDVADDGRCSASVTLADLPKANLTHGAKHYASRGGGLAGVGDEIFVFTDDHNVHCVNGLTGTKCAGYGSPRPNGLASIGLPAHDPNFDVSGAGMDRIIHPDGRVYVSFHVMPGAEADGYEAGTWVHCWDSRFDNACTNTGFTPYKVHAEGHPRFKGRLFFFRNSDGSISGVCSTDFGEIVCIDEDTGAYDSGHSDTMSSLANVMPQNPIDTVGVHTYHEPSNRLFLPSSHEHNEVHCWDFTFSASCGYSELGIPGTTLGVEAYGFVYEGDCLYGLGHTSYFFTMNPDGEPGCRSGEVREQITPCRCADGSTYWGEVEIEGDLSISGPFETFDIRVVELDNGPEVLPWISMIDHPTGQLPLDGIPADIDYVTLVISIVAKPGEDPFAEGKKPKITVTWIDRPVLSE